MKEIHRVSDNSLSSFGGGGTKCRWWILSLILLQVIVCFSILNIIHPPPTGAPSKGRQNKFQP